MRNLSILCSIATRRHFETQEHVVALFIAQNALRILSDQPDMTSWNSSRNRWLWWWKKMAVSDGDEMFLQSEFEGPILPWDRFRRWVTCFCVVTFDLELGQALEVGFMKSYRFNESNRLMFVVREARVCLV